MRDYTIVSGTTTYFLYDGSSPVLEETFVASPAATTIQIANGMADGWRERYAATSFGFNAYGFDPQGSLNVEDSSFNTTQPAQNVYVFDGYGNRLVGERISNGSTTAFNIDPVQFGGQYGYYTDTSTGEVQLTHRYYDASTGHFLNRDPIGYKGGQNLYAFCGNNPIVRSDSLGLEPVSVHNPGHSYTFHYCDPNTGEFKSFQAYNHVNYVMNVPNSQDVDRNIKDAQIFERFLELKGTALLDSYYKFSYMKKLCGNDTIGDYGKNSGLYPDSKENNTIYWQRRLAANFNFGAMGAALGYDLKTLLGPGGHGICMWNTLKDTGIPRTHPQIEQDAIEDGYLYFYWTHSENAKADGVEVPKGFQVKFW